MCSTNSVTDEKEEIFSEGFYQKGNYCIIESTRFMVNTFNVRGKGGGR
jgi:hypothetical protein